MAKMPDTVEVSCVYHMSEGKTLDAMHEEIMRELRLIAQGVFLCVAGLGALISVTVLLAMLGG